MVAKFQRSMLHLQMGQEVLYLLMTISMVVALVLLIYAGSKTRQNEAQLQTILELEERISDSTNPENHFQGKIEQMEAEIADLRHQNRQLNTAIREHDSTRQFNQANAILDQPPIITLTEAQGYYFPSGSAELSDEFKARIGQLVVPRIVEVSNRYSANIVELVGHTDEVPLRDRVTNIDADLLLYLNGQTTAELSAGDNVGLGMARAAAVLRELRRDPRLASLTILPLSAGHTTTVEQRLASGRDAYDNLERRRIDIRVRRR